MSYTPQSNLQREAVLNQNAASYIVRGLRASGKTTALLNDWFTHAQEFAENARGLFLTPCPNFIARDSKWLWEPLGGVYSPSKQTISLPNGAILHLESFVSLQDAYRFAGYAITRLYNDEMDLGQGVFEFLQSLVRAEKAPVGWRTAENGA